MRLCRPLSARNNAGIGVYNGMVYLVSGVFTSNGSATEVVSASHIPSETWITVPEQAGYLPVTQNHMEYAKTNTELQYTPSGRENGGQNIIDIVFIGDLADPRAECKTSAAKILTL